MSCTKSLRESSEITIKSSILLNFCREQRVYMHNIMDPANKSYDNQNQITFKTKKSFAERKYTRDFSIYLIVLRSSSRRNAKRYLACLSGKFIISWLSLCTENNYTKIQEMKLVYCLHINLSIKTKLFGYFGLVCSSLFCFKNNEDNGNDDDLAASLNEFKWETLWNYSIERSMWAFVPSYNYIENFSASEWKQTEANVIRYIVTIKCFRNSFVLRFSWFMVDHSCWLSVVSAQHIQYTECGHWNT